MVTGERLTSTGPLQAGADPHGRLGHSPETNDAPCAPTLSADEPEDLRSIERAVAGHVGDAPQSDDLTIVYVAADR